MLENNYMIGIDIGGTNCRIGAVKSNYEVLKSKIIKSELFFNDKRPVDLLIKIVENFIAEIEYDCKGICMGFPGVVNKEKNTVLSCPNLTMFNGMEIANKVSSTLKIPCIIEHETILLLCHDLYKYKLKNKSCVIAIYLGTGTGNAIYVHGKILQGKNGTSGELGHIPILGFKEKCPCGNKGCIELFASGKYLEKVYKKNMTEDLGFDEFFKNHINNEDFNMFINASAVAIATEINILDPDIIILSGGVFTNTYFPKDKLEKHIKEHTRKPYPEQNLEFIWTKNIQNQGMIGAGIYAWDNIIIK